MLPVDNQLGGTGAGAPAVGSRFKGAVLAALVGLQFLGYLLVCFALHAVQRLRAPIIVSEILVSAGWYDPGSAYAAWFARHRLLAAAADATVTRQFAVATGFAVASAAYVACLLLVRRWSLRINTTRVAIAAFSIALPLLLLPQLASTDLWSYIMYGRVGTLHGANPFVIPPGAYPRDPLLARVYWKSVPSIYGPVWVVTCMLLTRVAEVFGGTPWAYVLTFKGFLFACHLANLVLIRRILRVVRPGRETLGAILYCWNPLVLFEFAGSGHNDCVMLTLLLAAIYFAAAGRSLTAAGWLTAAGLTKLPGMLALPAYSLHAARSSPGRPALVLARHALVAAVVAAALYAPFWQGIATFRATAHAPNLTVLNHSPAAGVAKFIERWLTGARPKEWWEVTPNPDSTAARVRNAVRHVSLLGFFGCLAVLSFRPVRSFDEWLDRMVWIFVAYLLLAAYQFNAWYATWLVPLAALVRKPSRLLVLSSIMFLVYYVPIDLNGRAALYFWPLLLLVLAQLVRFVRSTVPAPADEGADAEPADAPVVLQPSSPASRLTVVTPMVN